jgi:NADPH-dependent 2,4-dienoyl-CoA reductase/sulfur reductase-like enzyme
MKTDIAIIGGGAAGLSAALSAYDPNISILVIEREKTLGGILNQCIHNGFGLHVFKEELTGPEYAARFIQTFLERKIEFKLHTTVLDIKKEHDFVLTVSSLEHGMETIHAKAVILSSGCYERTRGSIQIPGERPKGIMPAGSAQRYLNMEGFLVGKRIFILGSGDIGLIMARRMTLEGAKVLGVAEIMPYSNGLTRNIVQCLDDFDIPLYLSHTVTDIRGKDVLEGITIQKVDEYYKPIPGTEINFDVDTLLLSIGLVPDISLFESLQIQKSPVTKSAIVNQFYETNIEGLFVCGNALHVHDLVDWVTEESEKAGHCAKHFILSGASENRNEVNVKPGNGIRYVVPQLIDFSRNEIPIELSFRVTKKMEQGIFKVYQNNVLIKTKKAKYIAPAEMEHLLIKPNEFISQDPIELVLEEVLS